MVKEAVFFAALFVAYHRVEVDHVHTLKNTFFNIFVGALELFYKHLSLVSCGGAFIVRRDPPGQWTSSQHKLKFIVFSPGDDVVLMHAVHRAVKFHACKILAA